MPGTVNMGKTCDLEVINPRGEAIDIVLLNWHVGKLPSKYLCLYPQIYDAFSLGQRGFLFQWVIINVEIPGFPEC